MTGHILLEVPTLATSALTGALDAAGLDYDLRFTNPVPDEAAATAGELLFVDRGLTSGVPEAVTVAVALGGAATVRALAPILLEYVRQRRTDLLWRRGDGTTVQISTTMGRDDLERILSADVGSQLPPGTQT